MATYFRVGSAALALIVAFISPEAECKELASAGLRASALGRHTGSLDATSDVNAQQVGQAIEVVRLYKHYEQPATPTDESKEKAQLRHSYVGRLDVGYPVPQPLLVSFDTASGNLMLPALECTSAACREHRRYYASGSTTVVAINADGTLAEHSDRTRDHVEVGISSMDFGDGRLSGELLMETVCLGGAPVHNMSKRPYCAQLGLVAATSLQEVPFLAMPQDGVVGLGLKELSVSAQFNFVEHMKAKTSSGPTFAIFFADSWGELSLGGIRQERLASPLQWAPVPPHRRHEGYWQVAIRAIRAGNRTLDICPKSGCRGVIDTSASRIGAPQASLDILKDALTMPSIVGRAVDASSCVGPELQIDVSVGKRGHAPVTLTLRAEDYMEEANCAMRMTKLDLPEDFSDVLVLGEPLLRRYYTVFDQSGMGGPRIGFGLAAVPTPEEDASVVQAHQIFTRSLDTASTAAAAEATALASAAARAAEEAGSASNSRFGLFSKLDLLAQFAVIQLMITLIVATPNIVRMGIATLKGTPLADAFRLACLTKVVSPPPASECAICLGSFEDESTCCSSVAETKGETSGVLFSKNQQPRWSQLRCGHAFHEGCILQWLKRGGPCPVCRGPA